MNNLTSYKQARAPFFSESYPGRLFMRPAAQALNMARLQARENPVLERWRELGGETLPEYEARDYQDGDSLVRIVEIPDSHCSYDDLAGDCYNPACHPDINANILKRQEKAFQYLLETEGVFGYESQFYDGETWQPCDSIWGFAGWNSFEDSGYDLDLMQSAMEALDALQVKQARALELERADLYHMEG